MAEPSQTATVDLRPEDKIPLAVRPKQRRALTWMWSAVPFVVVVALIFSLWAIASLRTPDYILPAPWSIATELVVNSDLYFRHTAATALEAGLGFIFGTLGALLGAIAFVYSKTLRGTIYPLGVALNSVPIVAVSPLLIISIGSGLTTKVVITAFVSYFPTLVGMTRGLRAIEPEAIEYFESLGAGKFKQLRLLRWPASFPNLFVALRIAASATVISAVIAEWVAATEGLGFLIIRSSRTFQILQMWSAVVAASLLSLFAFLLVVLVERRVLAGRPEEAG